MYDEGVIKFEAEHTREVLSGQRYGALCCRLVAWREIMSKTQLVGQDPNLYGGAGYGNVSARVGPPGSAMGARAMLISGTQTGGLAHVGLDDFCLVERYDYRRNRVRSRGMIEPSSETMTHGAIYDLSPHIRFVFHGHGAIIWRRARALPSGRPRRSPCGTCRWRRGRRGGSGRPTRPARRPPSPWRPWCPARH